MTLPKLPTGIIIVLLLVCSKAYTQSNDGLGAWYMYNGSYFTQPNIELFLDVQFRYRNIVSDRQELFVRAFGIYHFNKTSNLGLGYMYDVGYSDASTDNMQVTNENRILLQYILNTPVDRTRLQHRFRLEQRWIERLSLNETDSRQRFRYRLMALIPIGATSITKGTFFVGLYDEIFIDLSSGVDFDQNRLYGGLGWQFSDATNAHFGYMLQSTSNANFSRLQFWIIQRINFYKD